MQAEQNLVIRFLETDPAAAARVLERHSPEQVVAFSDQLTPELTAVAFAGVTAGVVVRCMALMEPVRAAAVAASMPHTSCANVLRRMDPDARKAILDAMPVVARERVRRLIRYPEGTAGSVMETDAPVLPADGFAGEVRERLGFPALAAARGIWVVDRGGKLLGVMDPCEFSGAGDKVRLADLASRPRATISPHAALSTVLRQPEWTQTDELPVVDLDGVLLGVIGHRQLRAWAGAGRGSDEGDAFRTMLGLGELMWLGLHGLVDAVASAVIAEQKS